MDWILDFFDLDSSCIQQEPDSGFLNKESVFLTGSGLELDFIIC